MELLNGVDDEVYPMKRQRIRELGFEPGDMETGLNNAITDVDGVGVGHVTVIEGNECISAIFEYRQSL